MLRSINDGKCRGVLSNIFETRFRIGTKVKIVGCFYETPFQRCRLIRTPYKSNATLFFRSRESRWERIILAVPTPEDDPHKTRLIRRPLRESPEKSAIPIV